MKKLLSFVWISVLLMFLVAPLGPSFEEHLLFPHTHAQDPCAEVNTTTNFKDRINDTLNCIRPDSAPDLGTGLAGSENRLSTKTKLEKETGGLRYILTLITGMLASTAGIYGIIMMLKHAYEYISAKGADDKIAAAKKGMINSLIGILGVIFAYSFVTSLVTLIYDQISKAG